MSRHITGLQGHPLLTLIKTSSGRDGHTFPMVFTVVAARFRAAFRQLVFMSLCWGWGCVRYAPFFLPAIFTMLRTWFFCTIGAPCASARLRGAI
ncbi:hypothetical protein ebA5129 [Aromatoleum aromaticum EbN1]|uniref:Uncharacterized protein n=1 Tax=Aromatoleum aromaticum (strain DSM 19018 / LMG 30748 / EbN1) TaxID=76114 RepID=Q5P0X7_AROAE|nr:hypothetical protein ebA5129 [Aromatoleum aromaticum EbN1]